jgi:hypothetical protein
VTFAGDRARVGSSLSLSGIDPPIRDVIARLRRLPHCFTLQSCYGHFVWAGQPDDANLERLPADATDPVRYRIAYLALCIENSRDGRRLREALNALCALDAEYVQFGSPEWFWEQYPNSYAVQVEPQRFENCDEVLISPGEALHVQKTRDALFAKLRELIAREESAAGVVQGRQG